MEIWLYNLNIYRNRVKTSEERKHAVVKKIEAKRKEQGILKLKEVVAHKNRLIARKKKLNKPTIGEFKIDLWEGNYCCTKYIILFSPNRRIVGEVEVNFFR